MTISNIESEVSMKKSQAKSFIIKEIEQFGFNPEEYKELITEGIEQAEILNKKELSKWLKEMLDFNYMLGFY